MNPCLVALLGLFVKPEVRGSAVGAVQLFGDIGGSLGRWWAAPCSLARPGRPSGSVRW